MTLYHHVMTGYGRVEQFRAAAKAQWGAVGVERSSAEVQLHIEMVALYNFMNPQRPLHGAKQGTQLPWAEDQRAVVAQIMEEVLEEVQKIADNRPYRIIAAPPTQEQKR